MSALATFLTWPVWLRMSGLRRKADFAAARAGDLASGSQRRVRIQDAQLPAAKVSNPKFRGKVGKFSQHFKGHFSIGNVPVRILPGAKQRGGARWRTAERSE